MFVIVVIWRENTWVESIAQGTQDKDCIADKIPRSEGWETLLLYLSQYYKGYNHTVYRMLNYKLSALFSGNRCPVIRISGELYIDDFPREPSV